MNQLNRWMLLFVAFFCIFFLAIVASATNYYISPGGTDNEQCTGSNPCKTLSHASTKLQPGDTLYAKGGIYYGQGSVWFNNVLNNYQAGIANNSITIKSYPGETAVFDGLGTVAALFDFCTETDRWVVIDGLEIQNYLKVGIWIKAKAEGITVQNCYIHNIVEEHAIYIADYERGELGAENIIIRNNIMDGGGNYSAGVHCNHGSVSVKGLKIYNNIIKNYEYAGLLIGAGAEDIEIYNNTFYNNQLHTLQLGYDADKDLGDPWGDAGTWVENYAAAGVRNCVIKNNIIYGGDESRIALRIGTMNWSEVSSDNNLYFNLWERMMQWGSTLYTLAEFQDNTSNDDNSLVDDPLFLDMANGNFHLQEGSPAIDIGVNTSVGPDRDRENRPQGEGYDLGAYEYPVPRLNLLLLIPSIIKSTKRLH